jgi:uncharacterized protein (DUF433 family)
MKHYITTSPNIMGGLPCIVGTRIPVTTILYRLRDGHSLADIHDMYPWVDMKTLKGAIEEAIERIDAPAHA